MPKRIHWLHSLGRLGHLDERYKGGKYYYMFNGHFSLLILLRCFLDTNFALQVKTTKQAAASLSSYSYTQTIQIILAADGWPGLFGRGLSTRIMTNGLQSILFTVIWKGLQESGILYSARKGQNADDDDEPRAQNPKTTLISKHHEDNYKAAFRGSSTTGKGGVGA